MLGMASDTQRAAIAIIIAKSGNGKWTRYEDMQDLDCPERRMCEIMQDKRFGIKTRVVEGRAKNGAKTYYREFAV